MYSTLVIINQPGQSLFAPTQMYTSSYVKLPSLPGNGFVMYKISTTEHEKISSWDFPCLEDYAVSVSECINSHVEASMGCILPWRAENASVVRECSTADDFQLYQEIFDSMLFATERSLYKISNCYFNCRFKVVITYFT